MTKKIFMEKGKSVDHHRIVLILKKNVECFSYTKMNGDYGFHSIKKWDNFASNEEIWNYLKDIKVRDLGIICEEDNLHEIPFENIAPSRKNISKVLKDSSGYQGESFQSISHVHKQKALLVASHSTINISYWKNSCLENKVRLRFFEFEAIVMSRLIFSKFPNGAAVIILAANRASVYSFAKGIMYRKGNTIFQDEFDLNRLNDLFSNHRMIHQKNYPLLFDMDSRNDSLFVEVSKFWSGPIYGFGYFCESKGLGNYYKSLLDGMHRLPEYECITIFSSVFALRLVFILAIFIGLSFLAVDKKDVKLGYFEPGEYQSQKSQSIKETHLSSEIDESLDELNDVIDMLKVKSKKVKDTKSDAIIPMNHKIGDLELKHLRYVGAFKSADKRSCGLFTYMSEDMSFCEQQIVGGINFSFLGKENALVVFNKNQYRIDKASVTLYE